MNGLYSDIDPSFFVPERGRRNVTIKVLLAPGRIAQGQCVRMRFRAIRRHLHKTTADLDPTRGIGWVDDEQAHTRIPLYVPTLLAL